jgi:hypothetical protein
MATSLALGVLSEHLEPLAWLVGEWEGRGRYGDRQFALRFSYAAVLNGSFIQWRYQALDGGKVAFESAGMIGWDAEERTLVEFGFGFDGTIGRSRAEPSGEKDTWIFAGRLSTSSPVKEVRKTIQRIDADHYEETVSARQGDDWITAFSAEYARRKK